MSIFKRKIIRNELCPETKREWRKDLKKAKKRLEELDKMFSALFEEKVNGNINERNYKQLTSQYETEQITLEQKISEYEKDIRDTKVERENAYEFVDLSKTMTVSPSSVPQYCTPSSKRSLSMRLKL